MRMYKDVMFEPVNDISELNIGDFIFHEQWMDTGLGFATGITIHLLTPEKLNSFTIEQFNPQTYDNITTRWYKRVDVIQYVPSQEGDKETDI